MDRKYEYTLLLLLLLFMSKCTQNLFENVKGIISLGEL